MLLCRIPKKSIMVRPSSDVLLWTGVDRRRFLFSRGCRGFGRSILVNADNQSVVDPHVDEIKVAFENLVIAFQGGEARPGVGDVAFRQAHSDAALERVEIDVPATRTHAHGG